jgi:hypothetical protein
MISPYVNNKNNIIHTQIQSTKELVSNFIQFLSIDIHEINEYDDILLEIYLNVVS